MSFCSESEYVFLTGDFNAQTSNMRYFTCSDALLDKYLDLDQDTIDYFDQETFLLNHNISINRGSKDTKTNNTDYKIVDICKNNTLLLSIVDTAKIQERERGILLFVISRPSTTQSHVTKDSKF